MRARSVHFATAAALARVAALAALALGIGGCASLPAASSLGADPAGRFVEIGGHRAHVVVTGDGPPVVLLHGFGASSHSWRKVTPRLAGSHRVVAPDLWGFGASERPSEAGPYSRRGQLELVVGLMDRLGIKSAHVAGHSYGGGLALSLAALYPERVRSLVLVGSTAPDWAERRRHPLAGIKPVAWLYLRAWALRPANVRRSLRRSVEDDALVTDELAADYRRRVRVAGVLRAYQGLTAPAAAGAAPEVRLESIRQPVLVVWGRDDRLIDVEIGRQAADLIPDARWLVLEETGHLPQEERPEELARAMLDFLAEVEAPGAGREAAGGAVPGRR